MSNSQAPKCLRCIHYFSTYDSLNPRGCKKYGFRGQRMPSLVIKEETGEICLAYEERVKKKSNKGLDLNDDSLW